LNGLGTIFSQEKALKKVFTFTRSALEVRPYRDALSEFKSYVNIEKKIISTLSFSIFPSAVLQQLNKLQPPMH